MQLYMFITQFNSTIASLSIMRGKKARSLGCKFKRENDELIFILRIVRYHFGIVRIKSEFLNINSNIYIFFILLHGFRRPALENGHFLPPDRPRPQKHSHCKHQISLYNITTSSRKDEVLYSFINHKEINQTSILLFNKQYVRQK